MTKQYTIPIFVPHYGCPFDCVFCNQERITGYSTDVTKEDVKNTIETYLSYFNRDVTIEVGFFGGSFTGIEKQIQKELLGVAYHYKKIGKIQGIRLSTRPDFIDDETLSLLKDMDVDTIELGVQSLSDDVLLKSGRGHSSDDVYQAVRKIREYKINVGLQMMVGLPGDDFSKSLETCKKFIKINPFCVRIYPTLVIKDTNLENQYLNNKYIPLSIEDAIEYVSIYVMLFELNNIDIIRVGLQPTDNIQLGKDVIAGPFHPSIKQVIESSIYIRIIEEFIDKLEKENCSMIGKELIILSSSRNISSLAGQQSINRDKLYKKYRFSKIKFKESKELKGKDIQIKIAGDIYILDYLASIEKILKSESII